jgi:hypothetical protein
MNGFQSQEFSSFFRRVFLATMLVAMAVPVLAAGDAEVAEVRIAGGLVSWDIRQASSGSALTVHDERGARVLAASFAPGVAPSFQPPADGAYRWSLAVAPLLTAEQQAALAASRLRGDQGGEPGPHGAYVSGRLMVELGVIRQTGFDEPGPRRDLAVEDQVIADDLIVQGSACVGLACVDNESFGTDILRLKEDNVRLKFEDTSGAGFATTDWQLTANESGAGGADKFSIEDVTASRVPFTISGGASTHSIFVDSFGKVGFRTASPALDLHVNTSNTPALRLEQNNNGGFTAQTWDVAGNEANFFVRDVTGGSRLSLRIRPGAPTSSLDIAGNGNVGIGTGAPAKRLHVQLAAATNDTALRLENNEAVKLELMNTSVANGGVATTWFFQADNDANHTLKIAKQGGGGPIVVLNSRANANGTTMTVDGSVAATSFITTSTRDAKTDTEKADPHEVLEKLAGLEIAKWRFKSEAEGIRHLGPFAEDFKEAFGLGQSDKAIELQDASGVALAAIKALYLEVQQLKKQNAELLRRLPAQGAGLE